MLLLIGVPATRTVKSLIFCMTDPGFTITHL